jgi:uncharacterized MnhB-related membrane protein
MDEGLRIGIMLFVAVAATGVVFTRDTTSQVIMVSFYGLLLAIMFLLYQAPDVALSQLVVGALALPLMVLLALARVKKQGKGKIDS